MLNACKGCVMCVNLHKVLINVVRINKQMDHFSVQTLEIIIGNGA